MHDVDTPHTEVTAKRALDRGLKERQQARGGPHLNRMAGPGEKATESTRMSSLRSAMANRKGKAESAHFGSRKAHRIGSDRTTPLDNAAGKKELAMPG